MNKTGMLLISAVVLFGMVAPSSADSWIDATQSVNFFYYDSAYWACIYDYRWGKMDATTPGFQSRNYTLTYEYGIWDVQVAYLYDSAYGRYVQAMAIRDVWL